MAFTRDTVEQLSSERSEPAWLREARLQAWQVFEATPMPDSSKDEDWRRTDISKLDLDSFQPSLNGANTPGLQSEALPNGVIFCTLEAAIQRCPDLVREHMGEADGKFLSLNAALWSGGAFVYVPEGVQLEVPLMAAYGGDGVHGSVTSDAVFPRTLVVVNRGACLTFIEQVGG